MEAPLSDDAMVMLLYWRKCLLLVGERKLHGHVTMKDYTNSIRTLLLETASLYRKYNTFSDRESEQQHRTMTFAELPNHPHLLTMLCLCAVLHKNYSKNPNACRKLTEATRSKYESLSMSLWV